MAEQRKFNRTVAQINPLLDKIDADYSKDDIDSKASEITEYIDSKISEVTESIEDVSEVANTAVHYKGTVTYYLGLPQNPQKGDAYKVLYSGESGVDYDGTVYVWGSLRIDGGGEMQWVPLSTRCYTKVEVDAIISALDARISALEGN